MPGLVGRHVTTALEILRALGERPPDITHVEDAGPPHIILRQTSAVDRITLEVSARNPIRHLPGVFRRADRDGGGFLERMLWPYAHLLADLDRKIRQVPSHLDPAVAPPAFLPWLRRLVALPLDGGREAILRAPHLWRWKGTARGILYGLRHLLGLAATIRQGEYSLLPWWIGEGAIVGRSRLRDRDASLPAAFEVLLPESLDPERVRMLRHILDLLKPAHTACRLRFAGTGPDGPLSHQIGVTRLEAPHETP
jgi:phage tail-like protein